MFLFEHKCGAHVKWTLEDGTLTISGTGKMADYEQKREPLPPFRNAGKIVKLLIDENVTSIGKCAFSELRDLQEISIGASVTEIGACAFANDTGLKAVTIPANVTEIGACAFDTCSALEKITVLNPKTQLGMWAFAGCAKATLYGQQFSLIHSYAIQNHMRFAVIGADEKTKADKHTNRIRADDIQCAENVLTISHGSFVHNVSFISVDRMEFRTTDDISGDNLSLEIICGNTVYVLMSKNQNFRDIIFNRIKNILSKEQTGNFYEASASAFLNSTNATYVAYEKTHASAPETVTAKTTDADAWRAEVHRQAEQRAESDQQLHIDHFGPAHIPAEKKTRSQEKSAPHVNTSTAANQDTQRAEAHRKAEQRVAEDQKALMAKQLQNKSESKAVSRPADTSAADEQKKAERARKAKEAQEIYERDLAVQAEALKRAVKKSETKTNTPASPPVTEIKAHRYEFSKMTSYTVPDGITKIGNSAFYNCSELTSITFPDSVRSIGVSAFSECKKLTKVVLPPNLTEIGMAAFFNCESLTEITIPVGVKTIPQMLFTGCSRLKHIYYTGTQEQWKAIKGGYAHCMTKAALHCSDQVECATSEETIKAEEARIAKEKKLQAEAQAAAKEAAAEKTRRGGVNVRLIPAWSSNRKAGLVSALLNSDPAEMQQRIRKASVYDLNIFLGELNDEIAAAAPEDREVLKTVYDFADGVQKHGQKLSSATVTDAQNGDQDKAQLKTDKSAANNKWSIEAHRLAAQHTAWALKVLSEEELEYEHAYIIEFKLNDNIQIHSLIEIAHSYETEDIQFEYCSCGSFNDDGHCFKREFSTIQKIAETEKWPNPSISFSLQYYNRKTNKRCFQLAANTNSNHLLFFLAKNPTVIAKPQVPEAKAAISAAEKQKTRTAKQPQNKAKPATDADAWRAEVHRQAEQRAEEDKKLHVANAGPSHIPEEDRKAQKKSVPSAELEVAAGKNASEKAAEVKSAAVQAEAARAAAKEALAEKTRRGGVNVRLIPAWSSNRKAGLVSALLNSDPAEIQKRIRKASVYDLNIFLQELNDEIAAATPEDREVLKTVYNFADGVQKAAAEKAATEKAAAEKAAAEKAAAEKAAAEKDAAEKATAEKAAAEDKKLELDHCGPAYAPAEKKTQPQEKTAPEAGAQVQKKSAPDSAHTSQLARMLPSLSTDGANLVTELLAIDPTELQNAIIASEPAERTELIKMLDTRIRTAKPEEQELLKIVYFFAMRYKP